MKIGFKYASTYSILKPRLWMLVLLCLGIGFSQSANAQNCDPGTDSIMIDLTGSPDSVWNSPELGRNGLCCDYPSNYTCIRFILTLDPGTDGIKFEKTAGAGAFGSLDWRIACDTPHSLGDEICVNGIGPHTIIFCKPGGNTNEFRITAIPKPNIEGKLVINEACIGFLKSYGLIDTSITWESVPNDSIHNSYLSCMQDCDSVSIIPTGNFPSQVTYRVCGQIEGGCRDGLPFCDTATVRFVTNIDVDIQPKDATVCFGGMTADITANPIGGLAPFTYQWNTGATTQTIAVMAGTYWVDMLDSLACTVARDTVVVTAFSVPIQALAGNDTAVCTNRSTIQLNGQVLMAGGGKWKLGTGTFFPNDSALNAQYIPSASEILAGRMMLRLVTTDNKGCPGDSNEVNIAFNPPPTPIIIGPDSACPYNTSSFATNAVTGNSYQWFVTGGTIIGPDNMDVVDISWGATGTGVVSVRQTTSWNCDSTMVKTVVINPTPVPVINGPDSACALKTAIYSTNAVDGNTYLWTVTDGVIVSTDTSSSVSIVWDPNATGSVSVTQTNSLGCDSMVSLPVVINPSPFSMLTGPNAVCEYKYSTYTTNVVSDDSYLWTVTGGAIVGANNTTSVNILWAANGAGSVSIQHTNMFGCDSTATLPIVIRPTPAPVINGPDSVCEYKTTSFTTNTTVGNIYLWTVTGGTIQGANNTPTVSVKWGSTGAGSVTIKQTNTFGCDSTIVKVIDINSTPAPIINGPDSVCAYKYSYHSTNPTAGNTYLWTATGGTIVGANNAASVAILWATNGIGSISVTQTNTFGCDSSISQSLVITPSPAPIINGPDSVCEYKYSSFTTNPVAGSTYLWTVTGGSIVGTNNTPTVTILWAANGPGSVTIKQSNMFGCDSTVVKPIDINLSPAPVINGPDSVCEYKYSTFSTNAVAGSTYLWTVSGGSIVGANNTTSVNILWAINGPGSVTIKQSNMFGCDSTVVKAIDINPTPTPIIIGPDSVCEYKYSTFSTNAVAGNLYLWTVTGGSIVGAGNTSSVSILWAANGPGSVTIKQTNPSGCDSTIVKVIDINPTPAPIINGPDSVCEYKTTSFTTNTTVGNIYLWTVTGGTIQGANNTPTVSVKWSSTGAGSVTIKQTNTFGCDSTIVKVIDINPTPAPIINGPDSVCEYKYSSFTTNPTAGNTYLWTVTGGSIVGSNNTPTVTILWATNGLGSVTITQTNTLGCDSTIVKPIDINLSPAPIINGPDSVCEYKYSSFTTNPVAGSTYLWTVSGGSIVGTNNTPTVTILWAANGPGSVTIKQSNMFGCDSTVVKPIDINLSPAPVINGPDSVCEFKSYAYSTNAVTGSSYLWVVTGGTIVGANNASSVAIVWGVAGTGTVSVKQTNMYGCDSTVAKSIGIKLTPDPILNGPDSICEFKTASYSTNAVADITYLWTVTGGTILGANNAVSVSIKWNTSGTGSVYVKHTNGVGCDSTVVKIVKINPLPMPVITGPDSVCEYKTNSFTTNTTIGNTYLWTVTGGTIQGANNTPTVSVKWGSNGAGSLTIKQTNTFGCDSTIVKVIDINPTPTPVINGADSVCEYKYSAFTTNPTAGNTYLWSVTGGSIVGANNTPSVTVLWAINGPGSVTITQTNTLGCDSTIVKLIDINPTPAPVIIGPDSSCAFQTYSVLTNTTLGNTYLWTVSGGSILGANNTSSVSIQWNAAGNGSVTVKQTNTFGCDSTVAKAIVVHPLPLPVITGPDSVCEFKTSTYSTNIVAGSSYLWTVTGGTVSGANNTPSVAIIWNGAGTGTVSVKHSNMFGCDSTISKTIDINLTPAPVLNGPDSVCEFRTSSHTTNTVAGNTYLWTATGGTIIGADNTTSVLIRWNSTGTGSVSIKQTNTLGCDSTMVKTININPLPAPIITGPDSVCEYKTNAYTTNAFTGSSYLWTVTGGNIVGANNTSSVSIKWNGTGSGTISVKQTNLFGCDSTLVKTIDINLTPRPVITGPDSVCEHKTTSFSTNSVAGSSYLWTVTGGTISGADNASSVSIIWGANGTGMVSVKHINIFGCDSTVSKSIHINITPAPILNGPDSVCEFRTYSFATNAVAGHTYLWTTTGGTIVGANNTTSVVIRWGATGTGTVSIKHTNSIGCDSTFTKTIKIDPLPAPVITGPASVCEYKTNTYAINAVAGSTYLWTVTRGTIMGRNDSSSVSIIWAANGIGSVTVKQINMFGCDSTISKTIDIDPTPAPIINGPDSVCEYKTNTFSTNTTAGNTYLWTVTGGTIISANNTPSVTIIWAATGAATLSIKQTNTQGCDSTLVKMISIDPTPAPEITGPDSVCAFKINTFSTNTTPGNLYLWSVTGGSIVGANNTSSVSIRWNGAGNGSVTIKQTNTYGCDSTIVKSIDINPLPTPVITGPVSVCEYKTYTYSTNAVAGSSYRWTVTGGTLTSANDSSSSVSIIWAATGTGTISVKHINSFGCDSTIFKTTTINPTPTPLLYGPDSVCAYKYSYHSTNISTGHSYLWAATGGTIIGANNTPFVVIKWNASGSGSVSIKQTNLTGCDSTIVKIIDINPSPDPVINGLDSVCEFKTSTFTTNAVVGSSYLWTVTNGTILGRNDSSAVSIVWAANGTGKITIKQSNVFGCDSTVSKTVDINPTPAPTLTGPGTVCAYKMVVYNTNPTIGNTYYWTVIGGNIIGPQTQSMVSVIWGQDGIGTISIQQTNRFGCDSILSRDININPSPIPVITGPVDVCEHKTTTHTIKGIAGAIYTWTVQGGIIQSNLDTVIKIKWLAAGTGKITLKVVNPSLCDSTINQNIIIRSTPVPVINGTNTICAFSPETYSSLSPPGSTYVWSVTGGSIVTDQTQPSVMIVWGAPGIGRVTVKLTSAFGCDSVVSKQVNIRPRPVPVISGNNVTCAGAGPYTYSATPISPNYLYRWNVNTGTILGSDNTSGILVDWPVAGNQTVQLQVIDTSSMCDSIVILPVFVDTIVKPVLSSNSFAGCLPLSLTFSGNQNVAGYKYFWDFGDGNTSTLVNPRHIYTTPGVFPIKVTVQNSSGCVDSVSGTATANFIPKADFDFIYQNERIYANEDTVIFSNRSVGGNKFEWNFGTMKSKSPTKPRIQYPAPGVYEIELITIDTNTGCFSTQTKTLEVRVRMGLYAPNAFTPNGDGVNDYFFISVTNIVEFKLTIFNRWGEILYLTNDQNFTWDGVYNGAPAQSDVYGYLVEGVGYHGDRFEQKGTVTLLR